MAAPPTARTLYVGVDEAGYGPNLGPLVVAATSFVGDDRHRSIDWWKHLAPAVGRCGDRDAIVIDDSKVVWNRANGGDLLKRTVEAILSPSSEPPRSLAELIERVSPADADALRLEHWYAPESDTPCGVDDRAERDRFTRSLSSAELDCGLPRARILFPAEFNRRLRQVGLKSEVEKEAIVEILAGMLRSLPDRCGQVVITVDRLGGRRFYRDMVEELAGGSFVMTLVEEPRQSRYRFEASGREVEIAFRVQADRASLPVAAASMIAKHTRERCMEAFNEFWLQHHPQLRPTAGYPVDARRFRAAVESRRKQLGISLESFWREK